MHQTMDSSRALFGGRGWWIALAAALALYVASGTYVVRPDERGIVQRCGKVIADAVPSGIHWRLPYPFGLVTRLQVRKTRSVTVGATATERALGQAAAPERTEFLTGDENLIQISMTVHYTVQSPRRYLFATEDPDALIARLAQTALAGAVAQQEVDLVMTTGRLAMQELVRSGAQEAADALEAGVAISAVNIEQPLPPSEVAAAFRDVQDARADRQRFINEAEGEAAQTAEEAAGEAERLSQGAEAYREKTVNEARGEAERFTELWREYRRAPDVTSKRLYLDAMEGLLPKMKVIVVDPAGGNRVDWTWLGAER